MSYSSIIAKIIDKIDGLTNVRAIFDHLPKQFTVYPSVTVTPNSHEEIYHTHRDTQRTYVFDIRVYGNLNDTNENTQEVIRDLADAIIDELNKQANITLDDTVVDSRLTKGQFRFVENEAGLYIAELTYTCRVLVNRSA